MSQTEINSLVCSFAEYRQRAGEFFRALPTLHEEEAENAFKCLALSYLNCEIMSEREEIEAPLILQIASNKLIEHKACSC